MKNCKRRSSPFSIPQILHCSILNLSLILLAGCRNCDLVEAELRSKENELREMKAELGRAQGQNEALLRELNVARQGPSGLISPELASQTYTLRQITLGRGTGGVDNGYCPGDEALQVVVEPRDQDGHTIKAPGSLHIEALEISPEGLKVPLSAWDISPNQLRQSWRSGLFSTGYSLVLPWQNWPSNQKVRVVARFTLVDGRVFEAEKDVTVRLAPAAYRKSDLPLAPNDPNGPVLPDPHRTLPLPRTLDPTGSPTTESRWSSPSNSANEVLPANLWRPKAEPSLAATVELSRPRPLPFEPGEDPGP
jgi:hypothetical protein